MKKLKMIMLTLLSIILIAGSGLTATATEEGTTTAIKLSKYSDLDTKAQNSSTGMIDGLFKEDNVTSAKEKVYKIILPENGLYRINYTSYSRSEGKSFSTNYKMNFTLFSNAACTKVIGEKKELSGQSDSGNSFYKLDAGTYYLLASPKIVSYENNIDITFSAAFGYLDVNTEFLNVTKTYNSSTKSVVVNVTAKDIYELKIKEGVYLTGTDTWSILWEDDPVMTNGQYNLYKNGKYSIRLVDIYGNVYTKLVTVDEFQTPSTPTITSYKSGAKKVTGKTSPNCLVNVVINGQKYTTRSNSSGTYSASTAALTVGSQITVTSTNDFGISSAKATATVKNNKIAKPKVKTFKKKTRYVKGTAKKNTTAYVKIGKKTYKGKVNKKGKYSVKVPKLKAKTKIRVTIKDNYKNYSATVTVRVK